MDAVLGIAILEYAGQTGDRSADGHISVGTPDNVLSLLAEAALLRTAVAFVPDSCAAPDPPRPLERIGGRGELPPIDEHAHRSAGFTDLTGVIEPFGGPAGPGTLILGVAVKGRGRAFSHAGIFLVGGLVFLRLGPAPGGIGGIGDNRIEGVRGKLAQNLQCVAVDDLPAGTDRCDIIAHRHFSPFCFGWILERGQFHAGTVAPADSAGPGSRPAGWGRSRTARCRRTGCASESATSQAFPHSAAPPQKRTASL